MLNVPRNFEIKSKVYFDIKQNSKNGNEHEKIFYSFPSRSGNVCFRYGLIEKELSENTIFIKSYEFTPQSRTSVKIINKKKCVPSIQLEMVQNRTSQSLPLHLINMITTFKFDSFTKPDVQLLWLLRKATNIEHVQIYAESIMKNKNHRKGEIIYI